MSQATTIETRPIMIRKIARRVKKTLLRLKTRSTRFNLTKMKVTQRDLFRLCAENATDELTLVIHSEDVDYKPHFPNSYTVTKRRDVPADKHVDLHYLELREIPSESYNVVLCTGLLEHLPDPQLMINEVHRILKPGGRLIMSASSVFSFHEAPDNFFHFTPDGFRVLFKEWAEFKSLKGSSKPFQTIGILLQRANLQCDIFPPVRLLVELLMHTIPLLDMFVLRQYNTLQYRDERSLTDTMMPSNLQAVVVK